MLTCYICLEPAVVPTRLVLSCDCSQEYVVCLDCAIHYVNHRVVDEEDIPNLWCSKKCLICSMVIDLPKDLRVVRGDPLPKWLLEPQKLLMQMDSQKAYRCTDCHDFEGSHSELYLHRIRDCAECPISCIGCRHVTPRHALREHIKTCSQCFCCPECHETFHQHEAREHLRQVHGYHSCPWCMHMKQNVRTHIETHECRYVGECFICKDQGLHHPWDLLHHYKFHQANFESQKKTIQDLMDTLEEQLSCNPTANDRYQARLRHRIRMLRNGIYLEATLSINALEPYCKIENVL